MMFVYFALFRTLIHLSPLDLEAPLAFESGSVTLLLRIQICTNPSKQNVLLGSGSGITRYIIRIRKNGKWF